MNAAEVIEKHGRITSRRKKSTITRYEPATGGYNVHKVHKEDAEVIGKELERIERETGKITPQRVVEQAFQPGTPLYWWDQKRHYFEADDTAAATAYRVYQARQLIASIEVIIEVVDAESIRTRAFQNVGSGEDRGYLSLDAIGKDETYVRTVIERFRRDLARLERDYRYFQRWTAFESEFGDVMDVISKATAKASPGGPISGGLKT